MLTAHYYAERAWNNPETDPSPEGWYLVDESYPLHIYPIVAGPFDTEAAARAAIARTLEEMTTWT